MSWVERIAEVQNRFLDRVRSPEANRVAEQARTGRIEDFRGRRYCVLVTYRKNGTPIPSPLWFGVGGSRLYVHTGGVKIKRIERTPEVLVAPSTFRGRPLGAPVAGTARVLAPDNVAEAEQAIQANYGWSRRVYYRLFGLYDIGFYIEVTPYFSAASSTSVDGAK